MEGKWGYSTDGELFTGECETREQAIADGRVECDKVSKYYVGRYTKVDQPEELFDAGDFINHVSEQDSYLGEYADNWDMSTNEQRKELTEILRAAIAGWLDKHKLRPKFWLVECVTAHEMDSAP